VPEGTPFVEGTEDSVSVEIDGTGLDVYFAVSDEEAEELALAVGVMAEAFGAEDGSDYVLRRGRMVAVWTGPPSDSTRATAEDCL
jgi:hypothetical protein